MKFRLYEIELSGEKTKIYSPMLEGDSITLFEKFLIENDSKYPFETLDIIDRLEIAGHETGILTESFDTNSSKLREIYALLRISQVVF